MKPYSGAIQITKAVTVDCLMHLQFDKIQFLWPKLITRCILNQPKHKKHNLKHKTSPVIQVV